MAARIQRLSGILEGLKKGNEVNIETEALRTKFSKNKLQVAAGNANDAYISDLFEGSERGDLGLCLKRVQNAPFTSYKLCVDCAFIVVSPFLVWLSFQRCFYEIPFCADLHVGLVAWKGFAVFATYVQKIMSRHRYFITETFLFRTFLGGTSF